MAELQLHLTEASCPKVTTNDCCILPEKQSQTVTKSSPFQNDKWDNSSSFRMGWILTLVLILLLSSEYTANLIWIRLLIWQTAEGVQSTITARSRFTSLTTVFYQWNGTHSKRSKTSSPFPSKGKPLRRGSVERDVKDFCHLRSQTWDYTYSYLPLENQAEIYTTYWNPLYEDC